jgi:hypothetical protein
MLAKEVNGEKSMKGEAAISQKRDVGIMITGE